MGLTQKELAEKIGVTTGAIGHLETFRAVSGPTLEKVAKFFGLHPDDICPPWMREAGVHKVRRIPTKAITYKEVTEKQMLTLAAVPEQKLLTRSSMVQDLVEFGEEQDLVYEAWKSIRPARLKKVLLWYSEGWSYEQIGRKLRLVKGHVFTLLNDATAKLLESLPSSMQGYNRQKLTGMILYAYYNKRKPRKLQRKMISAERPRGYNHGSARFTRNMKILPSGEGVYMSELVHEAKS